MTTRADGATLFAAVEPLGAAARCVGDWLVQHAHRDPDRTLLAERARDGWRMVSYGEALRDVRAIAQGLLGRGLGADRPLAIVAENGIETLLVTLAAMHVGIPAAPLQPAYATLAAPGFTRLRAILARLAPGAAYVDEATRPALGAMLGTAALIDARDLDAMRALEPGPSVEARFAKLGPDTIAKIVFTSGSTGIPKGVITTQRMLTANQQMLAQAIPSFSATPPVLLDWLPWSHVFGGNHNVGIVLRNGGTLYIDDGKPTPSGIARTLRNLHEIAPTAYFNVPRGYALLAEKLEDEPAIAARFFSRLDVLFNGGAALAPSVLARLRAVAANANARPTAIANGWGATETAPFATTSVLADDASGAGIGLPAPGVVIALVPEDGRGELRVHGPNVTPGYWRDPTATQAAFDAFGFWRSGDAGALRDPSDPERGLAFLGRIAENFKLSTGTWVAVGPLRDAALARLGDDAFDVVVCGEGRDDVRLLVFPAPEHDPVRLDDALAAMLAWFRERGSGSSTRPTTALVSAEPPDSTAGELTAKGTLNQRAVVARRAAEIERLYALA